MNVKLLDKNQWKILIISTLCVIFGVLFCCLSGTMLDTMKTVLASVVLVYGGICMVCYCVVSLEIRNVTTLMHALVSISLALLVLFISSFFVSAVAGVIAIFGIVRVVGEVKSKKQKGNFLVSMLVVGIVEIVSSVVLIVFANVNMSVAVVTIYTGVLLILEGLMNLVSIYVTIKSQKIIKKIEEELIEEESSQKTAKTEKK